MRRRPPTPIGVADRASRSERSDPPSCADDQSAASALQGAEDPGATPTSHDASHHFDASETKTFPGRTSLVHICDVADPSATAATMRDPNRFLVEAADRIGNVAPLRASDDGGAVSFDPFAASVHESQTIDTDLKTSLAYVRMGPE